MEKIEIGIKGLEEKDELEISKIFHEEKIEVELSPLFEKSHRDVVEHLIKIIFYDFDLRTWLRDGLLWEAMTRSLEKVWGYFKKEHPGVKKEIVIKHEKITIIFPGEDEEMRKMLEELPEKLKDMDLKDGKGRWVSYSKEKSSIEIKEY